MSDTYNPQPWLSPTDQPQRPVSVAVNVTLPGDANQADTGVLMKVAQEIVQGNTTQIDRFIASQRQQQAINPTPYKDVSAKMQGMRARWRMNNGLERLDLEVFPAGGESGVAQSSETNLDGYVCWVHADPFYPDTINNVPGFPGPYNIFFNGYLIEENYQPKGPVGGYPLLFGTTALLASSYVGDVLKENPLIQESALKKPSVLIPPHGWGNYDAGSGPDGSFQEKITKALGYWIFDWTNVHNPCQYNSFSFGGAYSNWDAIAAGAGPPVFDKGLYFKSSAEHKSPLVSRGKNGFSATLSPASKGAEEVRLVDVFIGEFYDRGKYRIVTQSWTLPVQPRRTISVNDSPLIFGGGITTGGFGTGGGMTFDLDPKSTTKPKTEANPTLLGPHDGVIYGATDDDLLGLTDTQRATYRAWQAQVKLLVDTWQASIQGQLNTLTDALHALQPQVSKAYKLAIIGRYLYGDVQRYETFFPDYETIYKLSDGSHVSYSTGVIADAPHPISTAQVVSYTGAFNSSGAFYYASSVSITYGPTQQFYLDLTSDFNTFVFNLHNPLVVAQRDQYTVVPGTAYDILSPDPVPFHANYTESTGATYEQFHYGFLDGDVNKFFGPGTYAILRAQIDAYVTNIMTQEASLLAEYQALANSTPPNAPPMPFLGDRPTGFDHSNISISGSIWTYNQNP